MRNLALMISTAAFASAVMFAKPGAASGAADGGTPAADPLAALGITFDVAMPDKPAGARGGEAKYPFDKLEAPKAHPTTPGQFLRASFPVTGTSKDGKPKSAKSMASTVSSANKRMGFKQKIGADGKPEFVNVVKDGKNISTPVTEPIPNAPKFKAYDVDPAKDPAKASVRVFRIA